MVLGLATYNNPAYRPALLYPPSHHSFDRFEDGLIKYLVQPIKLNWSVDTQEGFTCNPALLNSPILYYPEAILDP